MKAALPYMPEHRARHARSRALTLDILLDEGRATAPLAPGALDLILMGYRFHHPFHDFLRAFSPKHLKPRLLEDVLQVVFGAIISRDQTPLPALVSEGVNTAKKLFGAHTGPVANAFLRRAAASRDELKQRIEKEPAYLLGPALAARWQTQPALLQRLADQLRRRPEAGIPSFNADGIFSIRDIDAFRNKNLAPLQAMDPGSWLFLEWLTARLLADARRGWKILDACAAPGGKTVGLRTLLRRANVRAELRATDADFKRLEKLRANLDRWDLANAIPSMLSFWGGEEVGEDWNNFDLVLADLPCSGTGTIHTRPDLLIEELGERVKSLASIQESIIKALRSRVAKGGWLVVSVCSVDPEELSTISRCLGVEPEFSSFEASDQSVEGITAWIFRID